MKGKGKKVDVSDMNKYIIAYRKLWNIPQSKDIPFAKRVQIVLDGASDLKAKNPIGVSYVAFANF